VDNFKEIYNNQAFEYHRMIAREDVEGNLLPAMQRILPLKGKRLLDLGSGTGRIPLLVHSLASQVIALDAAHAMLLEQKDRRAQVQGHWPLVQGDVRRLPFPAGWADLVTAGWAAGHFCGWYPQTWKEHIGQFVREMQRVVKPGGVLMIFETLTTGSLSPVPPTAKLAAYYQWLERNWGFSRTIIRTDYQFASVEQAVEHTEFFFGSDLAETIRQQGWSRLPEWTGLWHKVKERED